MKIKLLLAGAALLTLSGCFDSDDDDPVLPEPNNPPSAIDATFVTQTEVPIDDSVEGSDPDNDSLTFALEEDVSNGSLTLNSDGSFTYTPDLEFTGSDEFTFSVSDGGSAAATGTASITVEALQVLFSELSRSAFAQPATAEPLRVNGRIVTNDVEDPNAYDDLLID
ncbi:Ig-like domain-containing protein [Alteromonas oceanisediminis]|uniref:Ig-like domain-containing protein n=1 Tax=Alteromonas oceanisediminis TaxID=2836180 RepID=UPI001BDAC65F|nr:Ig-like domain-containing protein [Alteromonas oceanisediminis]MBT0585409.1 cadherin-like domain-containing protein [Alteromonas oceanisediminis]